MARTTTEPLPRDHFQAKAKAFTKKCPPDIVLYFDRLDVPTRSDFGDLPLLRTITNTFGAAVWFNAIVVLTHASTAPPDAPNGQPMSYEMYVQQRSHIVQQTIRQAAGDLRLMVRPRRISQMPCVPDVPAPVRIPSHLPRTTQRAARTARTSRFCRTARCVVALVCQVLLLCSNFATVQIWKPQLLLLCFASKILTEANSLLNLQARVRLPRESMRARSLFASAGQHGGAPDEPAAEGSAASLPAVLAHHVAPAAQGTSPLLWQPPGNLARLSHAPQAYVDDDGYPPDDGEPEQFPQEESKQVRGSAVATS